MVAGPRFKFLVASLSLLPTPVILFLSTSLSLYLENQEELGHRVGVLVPFFGAAFALFLVGGVLYFAARRFVAARVALWMYYLAAPLYLGYSLFANAGQNAVDSVAFVVVAPLILLALSVLCARWRDTSDILAAMAAGGLLLAAYEFGNFAVKKESAPSQQSLLALVEPDESEPRPSDDLPNVYHLLLDQYQGDAFDVLVPDDAKQQIFDGFVYYPNTVAQFGKTYLSVPSMFLSQISNPERSMREWRAERYLTGQSFVSRLKRAGYRTIALTYESRKTINRELALGGFDTTEYDGRSDGEVLFDRLFSHSEYVTGDMPPDTSVFVNLWWVSAWPKPIASRVVEQNERFELEEGRAMSAELPVVSYRAFKKFLDVEPRLRPYGRYTFLHYIIPHPPYVLAEDCSIPSERPKTQSTLQSLYLAQCQCATNVAIELIQTLKRLGRYDNALIVVHSDHGSELSFNGAEFVANFPSQTGGWAGPDISKSRSDALLLVKPPQDFRGAGAYSESEIDARLIDIGPTVLDILDLEPPDTMEGLSLVDPTSRDKKRPQVYHWYDRNENDRFELTRWDFTNPNAPESAQLTEETLWRLDSAEIAERVDQRKQLEGIGSLPPEQQERLRQLNDLPDHAKEFVRSLKDLPPEERERAIKRFKKKGNPDSQ